MSKNFLDKVFTIINDKMDHSKITSLHFCHKSKAIDSLMKFLIVVTSMITRGHGDIRYVHYRLDIFPSNLNHFFGSIARLLKDLESLSKQSTHELFPSTTSFPLINALLKGSEICVDSLPPSTKDLFPAQHLLPTLTLQVNNASRDNKNRFVFAFCSLLVNKGVFREIFINFLIVEHINVDIDVLFDRSSNKLKTNDYPTLLRLMKSFIDFESRPMLPHLIEEVPNFKGFVEGYLYSDNDALEGHTHVQEFKFYKDSNEWPLM